MQPIITTIALALIIFFISELSASNLYMAVQQISTEQKIFAIQIRHSDTAQNIFSHPLLVSFEDTYINIQIMRDGSIISLTSSTGTEPHISQVSFEEFPHINQDNYETIGSIDLYSDRNPRDSSRLNWALANFPDDVQNWHVSANFLLQSISMLYFFHQVANSYGPLYYDNLESGFSGLLPPNLRSEPVALRGQGFITAVRNYPTTERERSTRLREGALVTSKKTPNNSNSTIQKELKDYFKSHGDFQQLVYRPRAIMYGQAGRKPDIPTLRFSSLTLLTEQEQSHLPQPDEAAGASNYHNGTLPSESHRTCQICQAQREPTLELRTWLCETCCSYQKQE